MNMMIIGAGGHAEVVADALRASSKRVDALDLIGFLDDDKEKHGSLILGYPVLGAISLLEDLEYDALFVAIGDNRVRRRITDQIARPDTEFPNIIHPSAVIATDVSLGEGTIVCAGAVVGPGSFVGSGVIINTCASIDHHNCVGDFAHVAPGSHTGGNVTIEEGVLVGLGASILPGRKVGEWSSIGAGAVIIEDVAAQQSVVGIPAYPISKSKDLT